MELALDLDSLYRQQGQSRPRRAFGQRPSWRVVVGPGIALGLALLVVLACGGANADEPRSGAPHSPTRASSRTRAMSVPADAVGPVADSKADATRRTGTEFSAWQLVDLQPMQWPDTSLGCPSPGMVYAQVVTPGYLIRLQAGARTLEYHSGAGHTVYCGG